MIFMMALLGTRGLPSTSLPSTALGAGRPENSCATKKVLRHDEALRHGFTLHVE
jgi:hypothetical protein